MWWQLLASESKHGWTKEGMRFQTVHSAWFRSDTVYLRLECPYFSKIMNSKTLLTKKLTKKKSKYQPRKICYYCVKIHWLLYHFIYYFIPHQLLTPHNTIHIQLSQLFWFDYWDNFLYLCIFSENKKIVQITTTKSKEFCFSIIGSELKITNTYNTDNN